MRRISMGKRGAHRSLPEVHQMLSHISLTFLTWLSANLGEHTLLFQGSQQQKCNICSSILMSTALQPGAIQDKWYSSEAEGWTK